MIQENDFVRLLSDFLKDNYDRRFLIDELSDFEVLELLKSVYTCGVPILVYLNVDISNFLI
jgi:hypothetical protein